VSRYLVAKLLRDLRGHWAQFVAVFLMALLSVLIYSGLEGAWYGLSRQLDEYATDTRLADVWVRTTGTDATTVRSVAALGGLEVEAARTVTARVADDDGATLEVELVPDTAHRISTPVLADGSPVTADARDGIWLGLPYAQAHGHRPGDVVEVDVAGSTTALTVLGTYSSPEKLYFTGSPSLVAPEPARYGYALVRSERIDAAVGSSADLLRITTDDAGETTQQVREVLGDEVVRVMDRSSDPSVSTAFDRVDQIRNLSLLFSFIFVLLAVLAMYSSMRRLVDMQARGIATFKALGLSSRTIGLHYVMYGLVAGGAGAAIGLAVSPLMSNYVLGTQQTMISMPTWGIAYTVTPLLVCVAVIGVCALGAYLAARPALRGVPAEQLRPGVARGRRVVLERVPGLWRRIGFGGRWAWRDSATNPTRFGMGVLAVAGSIMLLFAGFGMPDSMSAQVRTAFVEENTYGARATLTTGAAPFGAEAGADPQRIQESIVRTVPSDGFDRVVTVVGDGSHVHLLDEGGAPADLDLVSVTQATAERLDTEVGDTVTLALPGGQSEVTVEIEQVVRGSAPQGFYLSVSRWAGLGQTFEPTTLLVDDTADLRALSARDDVSDVLTLEQQHANATAMVEDLGGIFTLIRVFAILLAVIVLYSLGALAFTERRRDYATLRVLGFGIGELRRLASLENLAATALGVVLGIPAGQAFLAAYVGTFSTPRLEYTPQIEPGSVLLACGIAVLFSTLTTFLLGRRVRGIDAVSALKGVE
jgi:putative ABC transport system permease protein